MENTINEYLNYIKSNNMQNDLSDYFTSYVATNHPNSYQEYITPNEVNSDLNIPELSKINNPLITSNKKLNISTYIKPVENQTLLTENKITPINIGKNKYETGKYIMNYLQNKGLSKEQAAGITGNLYEESGFNTKTIGDTHLSTPSEGLAQWREGRLNNLKTFAKSKNSDYKDLNTQLDFLWNELNTSEKGALSHLKTTNNPVQAAQSFANKFERMKSYNKKRENNASYFYNLK